MKRFLITEQDKKSIFLISHRECMDQDDFNNIIEVVKSGGFTTIPDRK